MGKGSRQKGMNGNCSKFPRKPVILTVPNPTATPCADKAREAKKDKSAFVPTCKPDGTYQAMQCVGMVLVRGLEGRDHPENIPLERPKSAQLRQPSSFQVQLQGQGRILAASPN